MARKPLLAIAFAPVLVLGVGAPAAQAQVGTGTMNVHLLPPAGKTLTQSTIVTINGAIAFSQTTPVGAGTGPFPITNLPAAANYSAIVFAATTTAGETCTGTTTGIPITTNGTTITFVTLSCFMATVSSVPALGRHAALLGLWLALLGAYLVRRRLRA